MTNNLKWVKATHSGAQGNCVEVAALPGGGRAVRDSKDADGAMLRFGADAWRKFTIDTKSGA